MLFAKRETVCKEEKVLDPKFVCPSKAVWTFLKWVMVAVLCALIVKITVACKLYQAINRCDEKAIKYYLKFIIVLFVVITGTDLWLARSKILCALIEAGVGLVITGLFVCYAWTIAEPINHIAVKHGKEPLEFVCETKQAEIQ